MMNGSNHQFNLFEDGTEDRLRALEQRVEMQEDEITLLKSSMADMLRRLAETENSMQHKNNTFVRKPVALKGQFTPLPSRPAVDSTPSPRTRSNPPPPSPSARRRSNSSPFRNIPGPASPDYKLNGAPGDMRKAGSTEQLFSKDGKRFNSKTSTKPRSRPGTPSHFKEATYNSEEGNVRMHLKGRPVVLYCQSALKESYDISKPLEAPDKKLKLDWVYGYRGKDCRSNLYILPTGEMVYFIAAVVILYDPKEGSQRHYLGHNDDVKCLAIHPDKLKIATGQVAGLELDGREFRGRNLCSKPRQPHIRVWDAVSLNTLHVIGLGIFDRSVACVSFSKIDGGTYLCAIDESNDHVLTVWDWEKEAKLAESKSSKDPVVTCEFNPHSEEIQIVTCGKSHVLFWKLEDGQLVKKQGLYEKHDKPKIIHCLAFTSSGVVISGDSNGNLQVWAQGTSKRISKFITGAHEGAVFSICMLRDGVFVTGGKDGRIVMWDADFNKTNEVQLPNLNGGGIRTISYGTGDSLLVGTKKNSILYGSLQSGFDTVVKGHVEELWGLAAHPNKQHFITGAYDRNLTLWDADTHKPIWTKEMDDQIQSADFFPCDEGAVVAVAMTTGRWLVLDSETSELVTVHTDGNEQHDVITYSPDGNFIAIGSHDNNIYIYAVSENGRKYQKQGKCVGHSSYITHVDWSSDSTMLQSNSGDYEVLYWDARTCKQIASASSTRDVEWATSTCTLGFNAFGVWPEGADGTDVNAVCRSHDTAYLASGDDFGKVHLYKYPCNKPRAPSSKHSGHSSHVTCVRFLGDDSTLLSTGGQDCGIMQWKVV
uniref:echinoderm microtubule-associated protein-like 2 isoform X2 n=1 Tax=Styela clava TaxID=7725 RepID=UPI0019393E8A|nr:echinoderm microtubule-associated protein-like 2 isoform X2 [Styela clava]